MNQDWSLALRLGVLVSEFGGARGPDHLVTLLNQIQQVGWLGGRSKVGPVGVLKLSDIPKRLEWERGVIETEVPYDDDRVFIRLIRLWCLMARPKRGFCRGVNGSVLGIHVDESLGISLDLERAIVS